MNHPPNLRLRRRQPRLLGNLLASAACAVWVGAFVAWGLMPGPTEPDTSVDVPSEIVLCPNPPILSDPDC